MTRCQELMRRAWPGLLLAAAVVAFGAVSFRKCCLLVRPQGDFRVFTRAATAARFAPEELYTTTDHNGWHYHYPPGFAVPLAPFAEGEGSPSPLTLPYKISFVLFYVISVAAVAGSVWLLVGVAEARHGGPASRGQWWARRVGPVLACAVPIGIGLSRGQVQAVLLVLLAGFVAALYHGRRFLAGLLLAAACFKVIPAFLVILPLARRDWRCLGGVAAGLVVWGAVVPAAWFGPERAVALTREWAHEVVLPGVGVGTGGASRQAELLAAGATHAQCFVIVWHKTLHLGGECPPKPGLPVRAAHLLAAAALTAAALRYGRDEAAQACALVLVMVLVSPTGHVHYLTLAVPVMIELLVSRRGRATSWLFATFFVANLLAILPGLEVVRGTGAPLYAACALLAAALWPERPTPVALAMPASVSTRRAA